MNFLNWRSALTSGPRIKIFFSFEFNQSNIRNLYKKKKFYRNSKDICIKIGTDISN